MNWFDRFAPVIFVGLFVGLFVGVMGVAAVSVMHKAEEEERRWRTRRGEMVCTQEEARNVAMLLRSGYHVVATRRLGGCDLVMIEMTNPVEDHETETP